MVLMGFLGFGALLGLKAALPWLIELSKDLWMFATIGGSLFALIFFLMLPPVRRTIRLQFETFAQGIYDGFIRRNPDKVMDNHLRKMGEKVKNISLHKRNLGQQRGVLIKEIENLTEEREQLLHTASQAKNEYEKGGPSATQFKTSMAASTSKVGSRDRVIKSVNAMIKKVDATLAVVDKMEYRIEVLPDLTIQDANFDGRTTWQRIHDNVLAVIENRASKAILSSTVNGVSLSNMSHDDLIALLDRARYEVEREADGLKVAEGNISRRNVLFRFYSA
jgi:hypothetical protein